MDKHRSSYILSGFVISNLVVVFIGAFLFNWFWNVDPAEEDVSLLILAAISIPTLSASIASYFWSVGNLKLGLIRGLAIPNVSWIWFIMVLHPQMGINPFFRGFGVFIVLFSAFLGTWFGRRFFYE